MIHATSYDCADISDATEMESESGSHAKAISASKQWDFPDIETLPREIFNDPRNGYLREFRMNVEVYQEVARNIQSRRQGLIMFPESDSGYLRIRTVPGQLREAWAPRPSSSPEFGWSNLSFYRSRDRN